MDKELILIRKVYLEAKRRCQSILHKQHNDYGGRGIEFRFNSFEDFYAELGPRPPTFQLDRINNNGNYEVGNVRWTSAHLNSNNTRIYKSNKSGVKGVTFKKKYNQWIARCQTYPDKKEVLLYCGKDFFEACCARLSWENHVR